MRYVIVDENNIVIDVENYNTSPKIFVQNDTATIGDIWDNGSFITNMMVSEEQQIEHLVEDAKEALAKSDITLLRCLEAGFPIPHDWAVYRHALRVIIQTGYGVLPEHPQYPQGT